ncbi:MAG: hypothetical protein ACF8GE_05960 [Phycisphaerales bacterium JB043]
MFKQAIGKVVDVSIRLDADAPRVDLQSVREEDRKAMQHPLVKDVQELFDAQVVEIERVPSKPRKAT